MESQNQVLTNEQDNYMEQFEIILKKNEAAQWLAMLAIEDNVGNIVRGVE